MDGVFYLKFVASLVFVLSILGLAAFLVRKYGGIGPGMKPGHLRRMKVIEVMPVDHRKKLILFQIDQTEHLVLLGQNNDTLISTNPASIGDKIHA